MFNKSEEETHNFWVSYTDLVLGFMIVFIVITLVLSNRVNPSTIDTSKERQTNKTLIDSIKDLHTVHNALQIKVDSLFIELQKDTQNIETPTDAKYKELASVFGEKFKDESYIEVTNEGTIRFVTKKKELFEIDKYDITPRFERALNAFIPTYLKEIKNILEAPENNYQIKELRIEGHTDSSYKRANRYEHNLKLSANRARSVQEYVLDNLPDNYSAMKSLLKLKTVICGYGHAKRLDKEGNMMNSLPNKNKKDKEDATKSRRVEFRILLEHK